MRDVSGLETRNRAHADMRMCDACRDVRGMGFMWGVEFVKNRKTKEHGTEECVRVFEKAKEMGVLLGKGGFKGSVLRIKPPMCITKEDVDFVYDVLDRAIAGAK